MPGVWEEVHRTAEYHPVPVEDQFGIDRENLMAVGTRRGRIGSRGSVWGAGNHHPYLAVPEWHAAVAMQLWQKLHERFMAELELVPVQLDELWANVKEGSQDMWLWIASDARTKLIPVMQVGGRSQVMAYGVMHELQGRLAAGCVPVFSPDGLRHYFYALRAHFGK